MSYLWIYCARAQQKSASAAYTISESCSAVDSRHNKTWFADHYSILWWPWFWFRSRTWQWTMESDYRKSEVWSVLAFSYSYVPLSLACVCVWTLWTKWCMSRSWKKLFPAFALQLINLIRCYETCLNMLEGSILARFLFKSFVSILYYYYSSSICVYLHFAYYVVMWYGAGAVCDVMIDEVKVLKNSRVLMHSKILFF